MSKCGIECTCKSQNVIKMSLIVILLLRTSCLLVATYCNVNTCFIQMLYKNVCIAHKMYLIRFKFI